jgi:hypothetical protein
VPLAECDDHAAYDCSRGRFAIADGVGVGFFNGLWAQTLVQQSLSVPLSSSDEFELHWWREQAARQFEVRRTPLLDVLDPVSRQDAEERGSDSTLLSLRTLDANEATGLVQLLAIGDSCAFISKSPGGSVRSFPFTSANQFNTSPETVASVWRPRRVAIRKKIGRLCPGMLLVLATDAVSEWLLHWPKHGFESLGEALNELAHLDDDGWREYLDVARAAGMPRDDATAMVIRLLPDDAHDGEPLGTAPPVDEKTMLQRQREYETAIDGENVRAIAASVGDPTISRVTHNAARLAQARQTVEALDDVLLALQHHLDHGATSLVMEAWRRNATVLGEARAAATLRETLSRLSFPVTATSGTGNSIPVDDANGASADVGAFQGSTGALPDLASDLKDEIPSLELDRG